MLVQCYGNINTTKKQKLSTFHSVFYISFINTPDPKLGSRTFLLYIHIKAYGIHS